MNGSPNHRRWRADLAAYLLGALETDEGEAMERHLESCERCRDELRWLQPAIDMIGESVPQLEPPPGVRARLMAEVRSDVAGATAASAGWEARQSAPSPRRSMRMRGFFWRPVVALTCVALIGAVIAGYALRGGGAGSQTTTSEAVAQGGAVHATLERSGDSGTLMLTGLEQPPPNHVYEAWVQTARRTNPSSLFGVKRNGSASTAIPHQLGDARAVMVTVEPQGGSMHPTSSPIVTVAMAG